MTDISTDSKLGRVIAQLQAFKLVSPKRDDVQIVELSSDDNQSPPKNRRTVKEVLEDAKAARLGQVRKPLKTCGGKPTPNPKAECVSPTVDTSHQHAGKDGKNENPYILPDKATRQEIVLCYLFGFVFLKNKKVVENLSRSITVQFCQLTILGFGNFAIVGQ